MKINKVTLVNFMGIKGRFEAEMPHIAALVGPNGMGKTTILNGIRYALTGAEPAGDIINKEADACRVSFSMTDPVDGAEIEFTRIKDREKPSKFQINGKAVTKKKMDEKIQDIIGIPLDKVNILSSSNVVASMEPKDFASFILSYIPEKLGVTDVLSFIPAATPGVEEIIRANIPEDGVDMDAIKDLEVVARDTRKQLKADIDARKVLLSHKPLENPYAREESEIREALNEYAGRKAAYDIYTARLDAYKKSLENAERHEKALADIKAQVDAITATRPDPVVADTIRRNMDSRRETVQNTMIAIDSASRALSSLEVSLANLNNPVCPLSEKIVCHEDKSGIREEIQESIDATKGGIEALNAELTKAKESLAEVEKQKAAYDAEGEQYKKKVALMCEYTSLYKASPDVLEKPEEVEMPSEADASTLEAKLKIIEGFHEGEQLKAQIEDLMVEYKDYDTLVKALSDKGCVRTGVVSKYLSVFEDLCNDRSRSVRPEIDFKFVSDNGVVVLMNNGKGAYLPYESLSGGEKAYMIFILMDMLNSLSGSNILFLDELSVVDSKCFDALLDIIMAYESGYDHILVAAVDHADTVESIKAHSIPAFKKPGEEDPDEGEIFVPDVA